MYGNILNMDPMGPGQSTFMNTKKTYRPCNAICTREGGYNFARDLDHIHGVVTSGNKKPDKVTPGSAPQQRPTSEHSQNSYICEHKP